MDRLNMEQALMELQGENGPLAAALSQEPSGSEVTATLQNLQDYVTDTAGQIQQLLQVRLGHGRLDEPQS